MTKEIFAELVKGIKKFIRDELKNVEEHNKTIDFYSDAENYSY